MAFQKGNEINKGRLPWNKGKRAYEYICLNCKNKFRSSNKRTKYCSLECYKKGKNVWNKGRKWSEEEKKRIGIGLKKSDKFQKVIRTPEIRKKWSEKLKGNQYGRKNKGKKFTEEHKQKISNKLKGRIISVETRRKISESQKGEKSIRWKGGKSFEPYTVDWTRNLRISIRERDKYMCRVCGEKQNDVVFHVHHIDYDKKNCNSDNLITLCKSCHSKTNMNRESWLKFFSELNNSIIR